MPQARVDVQFTGAGLCWKGAPASRPSSPCDLANTTYMVVRAEATTEPVYGLCLAISQDLQASPTASLRKAKVYCLRLNIPYPERLPNGARWHCSLVEENVELFRTLGPPDRNLVQSRPGLCLAATVRQAGGGGLVAMLWKFLQSVWEIQAWSPSESISASRWWIWVYIEALRALTPLSLVPELESGYGEDLDIDPSSLVELAKEWLAAKANQQMAFFLRKKGSRMQGRSRGSASSKRTGGGRHASQSQRASQEADRRSLVRAAVQLVPSKASEGEMPVSTAVSSPRGSKLGKDDGQPPRASPWQLLCSMALSLTRSLQRSPAR